MTQTRTMTGVGCSREPEADPLPTNHNRLQNKSPAHQWKKTSSKPHPQSEYMPPDGAITY